MARSKSHNHSPDQQLLDDVIMALIYLQSTDTGTKRAPRLESKLAFNPLSIRRLTEQGYISFADVNDNDNSNGPTVTISPEGEEEAEGILSAFTATSKQVEDAVTALFAAKFGDVPPFDNILGSTGKSKSLKSSSSVKPGLVTDKPYDPTTDDRAFQIRFTLRLDDVGTCWREVQVPASLSFLDLHIIIQECMHWMDYHLFNFTLTSGGSKLQLDEHGDDYDSFNDFPWSGEPIRRESSRDVHLGQIFPRTRKTLYSYDYGDGWEIDVKLVKTLKNTNDAQPRILAGEGAAPPEDVGGIWGYHEFLQTVAGSTLKKARSKEAKEMLEWADGQGYEAAFNLDLTQQRLDDWQLHKNELLRNIDR